MILVAPPNPVVDTATAELIERYKATLESLGIESARYSGEEMLAFIKILEEYEQSGVSPTSDSIVEADYWRPPPTIEEFCEDDYFLGSLLQEDRSSGQFQGMFPKWREQIYEAFAPGRRVNQIIFTGGIGLGKTFNAAVCLLYKKACLLCLKNPVCYYGLARTSQLYFSVFSVTKDQVKHGMFADVAGIMGQSPFFESMLPAGGIKRSTERIAFPAGLVLKAGSKIHQALGNNTLVTAIDEINFRLEKDAARAAKDMVDALERRQESRFKQHEDNLTILISSARNQVDFLTQHIEKNKNNPRVVIWSFPLWEVKGNVTYHLSGKYFPVDAGDALNPPAIINVPDHRERLKTGPPLTELQQAEWNQLMSLPAHRLIWVPEEHRSVFEEDPDAAVREIAGRATGRTAKLFSDIMPLINCLQDGLQNPFVSEIVKMSVNSTHTIMDCLADRGRRVCKSSGGTWVPARHPDSPRYIHMDMATGGVDAMGLSMVHPVYMQHTKRFSHLTQEEKETMLPVYELDFAMRIEREHIYKQIDFSKIRAFIMWLRSRGFKIRMISADLRNLSTEMRAILEKAGFKTAYMSMDRKRDGYDAFKQVIMEGRFRAWNHWYLFTELINLVDNIDMIDHPEKFDTPWKKDDLLPNRGSKDLADSVGGAIYMAETDTDRTGVPVFNMDPAQRQTAAAAAEVLDISKPQVVTF